MIRSNRNPHARRFEKVKEDYQSWRTHYADIQRYIMPRTGRLLQGGDGKGEINDGSRLNDSIIHSGPMLYSTVLSSGMQGGITSPSHPWFALETEDPALMDYAPVKEWLRMVQRLLMKIFSRSNFYVMSERMYLELGLYGTGAMFIEEDYKSVIRCRTYTAGEYMIALDEKLRPDSFFIWKWRSARNLVAQYGDKVSPRIKRLAETAPDELFKIAQCFEPREMYDEGKKDNRNMPFASFVWEDGKTDGTYLEESGFKEFPVAVARWDVCGSDAYGRGPGMAALSDVKMLHALEEDSLAIIEKSANPPMKASGSMQKKAIDTLPGNITYVPDMSQQNAGVAPLAEWTPDTRPVEYKIERVEQRIQRAFYNDLFATFLDQTDPNKTAYEAARIYEEKLAQLGPVLERLQYEFLDPVIERTFRIAEEAGILPDPPEEIQGVDFSVKYVSPMARAQRMVEAQAIESTLGLAGNMVGVFPEVRHKVKVFETFDEYADIIGLPPHLLRADSEASKFKEAEEEAQQAAAMQEQAGQAAQSAKVLSDTQVSEDDNMLQRLIGGLSGA